MSCCLPFLSSPFLSPPSLSPSLPPLSSFPPQQPRYRAREERESGKDHSPWPIPSSSLPPPLPLLLGPFLGTQPHLCAPRGQAGSHLCALSFALRPWASPSVLLKEGCRAVLTEVSVR